MADLDVILANPRGFCAGVNMAIEAVDQLLAVRGPPVYVYHEIVHNLHVVQDFRRRGVVFVEDLADVPQGALLVYSAHGVSPAVRQLARERGLIEVDATCPLVTKVHIEVLRFARQGYRIVFIGHRNHDEAVGTMGEAPDSIVVVESPREVDLLDIPADARVAYVTQTTLSLHDAEQIVSALRRRYPHIVGPRTDDICYATTNRQNAVRELSPEADLVLVIGSRNSSNSRRLVEMAQLAGREAHLIDDASELQAQWLNGRRSVLVTAGASAPEHLVEELLDRLRRQFGARLTVRTVAEENVSFPPPQSLRTVAAQAPNTSERP